jgi:hypothetical protein
VDILTCDFETTYSDDYSLSKMQTDAYIMDPRFETILVSVMRNMERPIWFSGTHEETLDWLWGNFNWHECAVRAHHTHFDGFILTQRFGIRPKQWMCTLSQARMIEPHLPSHSLAALAKRHGFPDKGTAVVTAKGKQRADFNPVELAEYAAYCMHDTKLCAALAAKHYDPFTPALHSHLIDMTIRMFTEPALVGNAPLMDRLYRDEIARKEVLMQRIGADRSIVMSGEKLAAALRALGARVPMKVSPTTKRTTYAFAKTDKAFTDMLEHPHPEVQALVAARLGVKSTIAETRAKRFHETALRGALPVYLQFWGAKCVPGDTEVLTRAGWVALHDWDDTQHIAQVTPAQEIVFDTAARFVGSESTTWVDIDAPYLQCSFTEGHTMPYLAHGSMAWKTAQAADMVDKASWYAPLSGTLTTTGALTEAQMRVLAMVQADGTFAVAHGRQPRLRVSLKKPRKIERARALFAAAGVDVAEQQYPSQPGYTAFIVRADDLPAWVTPERKIFGPWLLDSTPGARWALVDELRFWDGWSCNGSVYYCSTERQNAEWVVTLLHLGGRCGRISEKPAGRGRVALYKVGIRERSHGLVRKAHVRVIERAAIPYCATTKTGFFLARRNGRIFVTGNTTGRYSGGNSINWQNIPARGPSAGLREAICAPDGYDLVVGDSSNIELRMVMTLAGQDDVIAKIRAGVDLYCDFATHLFGRVITKADKAERQLGKTAMLSLQYGAGAERFQEMVRQDVMKYPGAGLQEIDLYRAQEIVALYRSLHHKVVELWNRCQKVILPNIAAGGDMLNVDVHGWFITLGRGFGRPGEPGVVYNDLQCDPRSGDWTYQMGRARVRIFGPKVVENLCQHAAMLVVMWQTARINTRYPVKLSVHDEAACVCRKEDTPAVKAWMEECLSLAPAWCRKELPVACEVGVGPNYMESK